MLQPSKTEVLHTALMELAVTSTRRSTVLRRESLKGLNSHLKNFSGRRDQPLCRGSRAYRTRTNYWKKKMG